MFAGGYLDADTFHYAVPAAVAVGMSAMVARIVVAADAALAAATLVDSPCATVVIGATHSAPGGAAVAVSATVANSSCFEASSVVFV